MHVVIISKAAHFFDILVNTLHKEQMKILGASGEFEL